MSARAQRILGALLVLSALAMAFTAAPLWTLLGTSAVGGFLLGARSEAV